jgi:hypothetical protein
MRPNGTQRPERPKSELRARKMKNAALARLLGRIHADERSAKMAPSRRGDAGLVLIRGHLHEPLMTQSIQALLSRAWAEISPPCRVLSSIANLNAN